MHTKNALAALAALAQEARLKVIRLLVEIGPEGMAASKISDRMRVVPSSLSFHMKELAHAKLVTSRQDGRFVIYAANFDTINELMRYLTENCCSGNSCVAARETELAQAE